jgi:ABC-type glycerol-3-phosphate transport system substrate-binding protein
MGAAISTIGCAIQAQAGRRGTTLYFRIKSEGNAAHSYFSTSATHFNQEASGLTITLVFNTYACQNLKKLDYQISAILNK